MIPNSCCDEKVTHSQDKTLQLLNKIAEFFHDDTLAGKK